MNNLKEDSLAKLPEEFRSITVANAEFFKVSSPLEQLDGTEPIKNHNIIATSLGHLIELCESEISRFFKLPWKDAKKILIHHEFRPLQLYIVVLRDNNKAVLLSYNNFKILHEWSDVSNVTSDDPEEIGFPSLQITDTSGTICTISSDQLLTLSLTASGKQEATERGKQDAASALAHRLKGGIKHAEHLSSQKRVKETFIQRKLDNMQCQLQGLKVSSESTLTPAYAIEDDGLETPQCHSVHEPLMKAALKIASIRHKIVHDKWVIGLNIVNDSTRHLICNMQLVLSILRGTDCLSYNTKILKVIQRKPAVNSSASSGKSSINAKVFIENLHPPILRPSKKACILGICNLPDFTEDATVVCSGLVTYTCTTLVPEETQQLEPVKSPLRHFQVSFEAVELNVLDLSKHHIALEKNLAETSVPFSTVALIAGSVCNKVTLTSLVSPLSNLESHLDSKFEIGKVCGVTDMYCFYPESCHTLRFAAVKIFPVNANSVNLELYTKDDSQALVLVQTLLATLPGDVCIQLTSTDETSQRDKSESIGKQLLAKMKEAATYVVDGYKDQKNKDSQAKTESKSKFLKTKQPKDAKEREFDSEVYNKEREMVTALKEAVTFCGPEYKEWRKNLYKIQTEIDELYLEYLK